MHLRSLRIGRGVCTPTGTPSHTLLDITKHGLGTSERGSSYPEGNFEGNQLLEGSMSLSPLCPAPTNDLHVSTATGFHRSFPRLHRNRV